MPAFIDLTGQTFTRLTVLERENGPARTSWKCKCSCGKVTVVTASALRTGNTKSCGCLASEVSSAMGKSNTTHGMTGTPEYNSWLCMRERCLSPNNQDFADYGGRGIRVCERWLNSFENFYADMGPKPQLNMTIDRINSNGNYEPGNCRWADSFQQANNRSNVQLFLYQGQRRTLVEISRLSGVAYPTLYSRVNRMKLTVEEAISWQSYKHKKTINQ